MRKILSKRIRQQRIAKKMTQEEVADLLDIGRAAYGYYENGKVLPPIDKLLTLANFFGVTLDFLVGNEQKQKIAIEETIRIITEALEDKINDFKN